MDNAIGNVIDIRSRVGSRLSAIESQKFANDDIALQVAETMSDLQDLDYAEALSRLSLQAFGLEAAQQSFVRTQGLSLFNYL